ncbi:MAG TPA: SET domain-containing protein [Candidatus Paceibacterota bacterium]
MPTKYKLLAELKEFLKVKKSPIAGRGLFTFKSFSRGETIFRGRIREGCYLIRHLNHSCRPNTRFIEKTTDSELSDLLISIKKIKPGEELTFDFRNTRWAPRYWPIVQKKGCRCPSCSG